MPKTYTYQTKKKLCLKYIRKAFLICISTILFIVLQHQSTYAAEATKNFKAFKIIQSHKELNIDSGKAFTFQVGFKNIGKQTWMQDGDYKVLLATKATKGKDLFYHPYWPGKSYVAKMTTKKTKPGEIAYFRFALQAPKYGGKYIEKFQLNVGDAIWMEGGELEIPITVNGPADNDSSSSSYDSDSHTTTTTTSTTSTINTSTTKPIKKNTSISAQFHNTEPEIRVGLFNTTEPIEITANKGFQIWDQKNNLLYDLSADKIVTISFDFNTLKYSIDAPPLGKTLSSYIKVVPKTTETVFEIVNYENRPNWNKELNDNMFEGSLEIRYSNATKKLWVINQLPIDTYLKGLAESSSSAPKEFQKALVIAARTYALYHYLNPSKHKDEHFTVDAKYDQIYRGYNLAKRVPEISQAVQDTKGYAVTYNNEIVITPYFSQSDGRTRSWQEVWGGDPKPWLVSVSDPYNDGKEKLGHGVGMSAQGAIGFAQDGKNYQEILKYYYTGIKIEKAY